MARFRNQLMIAALGLMALPNTAFASEGGRGIGELFEMTNKVLPIGWAMLILFLIGSTLTIMYFLEMRIDKLAPPAVVQEIETAINNGELDRAFEVSTQEHCYFGQIMAGGLMMKDISYEQMITGMEHVAAEEGFKINARISNLSLIGNVGPLLGLLGTVTGMISSFQTIEKLAAPTPADLASGVYESLVNTTLGLSLSIIFLVSFFFLKNQATKITLTANLMAAEQLKGCIPHLPTGAH
jgi:biopolymer transport protein ExbB